MNKQLFQNGLKEASEIIEAEGITDRSLKQSGILHFMIGWSEKNPLTSKQWVETIHFADRIK